MKHTLGRIAAVLSASAVLVTVGAVPANAASDCTGYQKKEFPTSGFNTDVEVKLCVYSSSGSHSAAAHVGWIEGGGVRKFDHFKITVRIERNNVAKDTLTCDYTDEINSRTADALTCAFAHTNSTSRGGWTADATVAWDLDADGEGYQDPWQLHGTAQLD